jgi:glycogen debranching enzyme
MYSGWGIRTLSHREKRYNPIGYHLGTVWPHDNSLIAMGFRRYGFDEAVMRVFLGLFEAATHFDQYRIPELISGFQSEPFGEPVRYPVACHPQAWAAGSIPLLMRNLLGLVPEALDGRLRIRRPMLPPFVSSLDLLRLHVGKACLDLRFWRSDGGVHVKVLKQSGPLEVIVEEAPS